MNNLIDAIAGFRAAHCNVIPYEQSDLLERIERSKDATRAWASFFKTAHRAQAVNDRFIFSLVDIHLHASLNSSLPKIRQDRLERNNSAYEAAREVEDFSKSLPFVFAGEQGYTAEAAAKINAELQQCRRSARWLQQYISGLNTRNERQYERCFPSSQKRHQPHLTYAIQLCREMKARFGSPGPTLVAAITSALYQKNDVGLLDSIKKAYAQEIKNRPDRGRFEAS